MTYVTTSPNTKMMMFCDTQRLVRRISGLEADLIVLRRQLLYRKFTIYDTHRNVTVFRSQSPINHKQIAIV